MCAVKQISCIHIVPTWFLIKIYLWIWVSVRFYLILFHHNVSMASDFNFQASKLLLSYLHCIYSLTHICNGAFIVRLLLWKCSWEKDDDLSAEIKGVSRLMQQLEKWQNVKIFKSASLCCLSLLAPIEIWFEYIKSLCVCLSLS